MGQESAKRHTIFAKGLAVALTVAVVIAAGYAIRLTLQKAPDVGAPRQGGEPARLEDVAEAVKEASAGATTSATTEATAEAVRRQASVQAAAGGGPTLEEVQKAVEAAQAGQQASSGVSTGQ